MEPQTYAYCPSCNKPLSRGDTYANSVARAQVHAGVTGHFVSVAYSADSTHIETIAGEPGLPLWDSSAEE
jgi:hypothetical protein